MRGYFKKYYVILNSLNKLKGLEIMQQIRNSFKFLILLLSIFLITCNQDNKKLPIYKKYDFKIESNTDAILNDSLIILKISIKNLDSINYYIPGSELWFTGSKSGGHSMTTSPGHIYAHHMINYFPLNTTYQPFFELNSRYIMTEMPFFYKIKPNETLKINIEILPIVTMVRGTKGKSEKFEVSEFMLSKKYDYNIISQFSIINEILLNELLDFLDMREYEKQIKVNTKELYVSSLIKQPQLQKIKFQTTKIKIDSSQSDWINECLRDYILVKGVLINKK